MSAQSPESVIYRLWSFSVFYPNPRYTEPDLGRVPRPCWQQMGGSGNGVGEHGNVGTGTGDVADLGMWGEWNRGWDRAMWGQAWSVLDPGTVVSGKNGPSLTPPGPLAVSLQLKSLGSESQQRCLDPPPDFGRPLCLHSLDLGVPGQTPMLTWVGPHVSGTFLQVSPSPRAFCLQ